MRTGMIGGRWWVLPLGLWVTTVGSDSMSASAQDLGQRVELAQPAMAIDPTQPDPLMQSLPTVSALSDVRPEDWAYQYVKNLSERYNLVIGDPDGKFRGNAPLTRDEFAAVLVQVLRRAEIFRDQEREELNALNRLLDSYRSALSDLRVRLSGPAGVASGLDGLEERRDRVQRQLFSPTTKLQAQVVQTVTDGTGANTTNLARVRLLLKSSFRGNDQLTTQLEFGNNGRDAIALAQQNSLLSNLSPNSSPNSPLSTTGDLADGGGLIEADASTRGQLRKLYYETPVGRNLRLAIGTNLPPSDFVDRNRFANPSGANFASSFLVNNPLIVQNAIDRRGGAGAVLSWQPHPQWRVQGLYSAASADRPTAVSTQRSGGLLGDRRQATVEAEYQPSRNFALRLQYTNAQIEGATVNAVGLNAEWAVRRELAVFGRLGFGRYTDATGLTGGAADLSPRTWMVGATVRNLLLTGSKAGIAIGQPFVTNDFGNATQTNAEAYFSFLLNDNINLIPSVQMVSNPGNEEGRTVWQWAFRAVLDF
jgi:hypothetical protein